MNRTTSRSGEQSTPRDDPLLARCRSWPSAPPLPSRAELSGGLAFSSGAASRLESGAPLFCCSRSSRLATGLFFNRRPPPPLQPTAGVVPLHLPPRSGRESPASYLRRRDEPLQPAPVAEATPGRFAAPLEAGVASPYGCRYAWQLCCSSRSRRRFSLCVPLHPSECRRTTRFPRVARAFCSKLPPTEPHSPRTPQAAVDRRCCCSPLQNCHDLLRFLHLLLNAPSRLQQAFTAAA